MSEGFVWGVAQSAYGAEGGLDTASGAHTNRWGWAAAAETPGPGLGFWHDPAPLLERAASTGAGLFCLGVEWSRIEPRPGHLDPDALDGYAATIAACRRHGLEPLVVLAEATFPRWLGLDAWTPPAAAATLDAWSRYVAATVGGIDDRLITAGSAPVRRWLTLRSPNLQAGKAYLTGSAPPGRIGALRRAQECLDAFGSAHVLAARAIRATAAAADRPKPWIGVDVAAVGLYDWCWRLTDVWTARRRGVAVSDLRDDLTARRHAFAEEVARSPHLHPSGLAGVLERAVTASMAARVAPPLPRTTAAVYACDTDDDGEIADGLAVTFADPFVAHWFRAELPRRSAPLGLTPPWERRVQPAAMRWTLRRAAESGLPLLVIDAGLATDRDRPRADGWRRPAYLEAMTTAVTEARSEGIRVTGYVYGALADAWTDTWEHGGFRVRTGLCAAPRTRAADAQAAPAAPSVHDALGDESLAAFGRIATAPAPAEVSP